MIKLNVGPSPIWDKPGWHTLDHKIRDEADTSLQGDAANIPLKNDTCSTVFTSHMFEHITDGAAAYLLEQVFSSMEPAGIIRIEVPCANKILEDYRSNSGRPIAKYFAESNKNTIVKMDGYPEKYAEYPIDFLSPFEVVTPFVNITFEDVTYLVILLVSKYSLNPS